MVKDKDKDKDTIILSLEKGINVLEYLCLSSENSSVTEISKAFGINKTTIYRILQTLIKTGFVQQEQKTSHYKVSTKILSLSNKVLNRMEIRVLAKNFLRDLAIEVNTSIHLAIMDGYESVIIDKVEPDDALGVNFHIGRRSPLYCTGTGKVFLAHMSSSEFENYLENAQFKSFTPTTHFEIDDLREEIKKVKEQGYALDFQEHNMGVSCIAAPIRDFSDCIVAAVSITGTSLNIEPNIPSLRNKVLEVATSIAHSLGHHW